MIDNEWTKTKKDNREQITLGFHASSYQTLTLPEGIQPTMIENLWVDEETQMVNIQVNGHTIELDSDDWSDIIHLDEIKAIDEASNGQRYSESFY